MTERYNFYILSLKKNCSMKYERFQIEQFFTPMGDFNHLEIFPKNQCLV